MTHDTEMIDILSGVFGSTKRTRVIRLVSLLFALGLAVLGMRFMPAHASGTRCYVNVNASGANDGSSWTDAYTDLQPALANANCTEIWVAGGTYYPTSTTDRTATFQLNDGVSVYGGFSGTELYLSQRDADPATNNTVLSGNIGSTGVFGDDSYHVVTASGTDATAVLDGFTIADGSSSGTGTNLRGAGIYNLGGSPTLSNLLIQHNQANGSGGGMYSGGSPTLSNVTFDHNIAGANGGGLSNNSGSPTLTNATFSNNFASIGGGMFNQNFVTVTMSHVTFTENSANNSGGGMDAGSSSYGTLSDVTFSHNDAGYGAGMYNEPFSELTLINVTFTGNNSAVDGGGIENSTANTVLNHVTFYGNTADGYGGAIYNLFSKPVLTDVTVSGNAAKSGGGIYDDASDPTLTNVDVTDNGADFNGGGLYNVESSPTLERVSFVDNTAGTGGAVFNYTGSNPTLTDVAFDGNTATGVGGGIYNYHSSPSLTNVTFHGNTAYSTGGGIHNAESSSPSLVNVTFSENSAKTGAALYNFDGSNPTLTNVTISGNSATSQGGGIDNEYSDPVLTNVILWGDSAPTGPEISNTSSTPTISYSDVQGSGGSGASWDASLGTDGGHNIDADPLLSPLANNGGFTQTMALQEGSPAIDTADDSVCPATDQRGVVRPQGQHCDMGAYEWAVPASTRRASVFILNRARPSISAYILVNARGDVSGTLTYQNGGVSLSQVRIESLVVNGNRATAYGGVSLSQVRIESLVVNGNRAIAYGGARLADGTPVSFWLYATKSTFGGRVRLVLNDGYDSGEQGVLILQLSTSSTLGGWGR